jgi:hypothetical protein
VGWLFESKSVTQTQRSGRSGRPGVSDECVEIIRASFVRSPTKSTRRASRELLIPRSTIHKVLHNTKFFKTPSGLCGHTVFLNNNYHLLQNNVLHYSVSYFLSLMVLQPCSDLIGTRIRNFPACSIVPQPTTLSRAHNLYYNSKMINLNLPTPSSRNFT